jgi:hypothetical protein
MENIRNRIIAVLCERLQGEPDVQAVWLEGADALNCVDEYSDLEKYLKRGNLMEAFGYYHKWLVQPLIEVLRMKYTPLHPDYYIVHISRHMPKDVLAQLEDLMKFDSISELEQKSRAALQLFEVTAGELAVQ